MCSACNGNIYAKLIYTVTNETVAYSEQDCNSCPFIDYAVPGATTTTTTSTARRLLQATQSEYKVRMGCLGILPCSGQAQFTLQVPSPPPAPPLPAASPVLFQPPPPQANLVTFFAVYFSASAILFFGCVVFTAFRWRRRRKGGRRQKRYFAQDVYEIRL